MPRADVRNGLRDWIESVVAAAFRWTLTLYPPDTDFYPDVEPVAVSGVPLGGSVALSSRTAATASGMDNIAK